MVAPSTFTSSIILENGQLIKHFHTILGLMILCFDVVICQPEPDKQVIEKVLKVKFKDF